MPKNKLKYKFIHLWKFINRKQSDIVCNNHILHVLAYKLFILTGTNESLAYDVEDFNPSHALYISNSFSKKLWAQASLRNNTLRIVKSFINRSKLKLNETHSYNQKRRFERLTMIMNYLIMLTLDIALNRSSFWNDTFIINICVNNDLGSQVSLSAESEPILIFFFTNNEYISFSFSYKRVNFICYHLVACL